MKKSIPQFIQPFLWSYDTAKIDPVKHKKRIIINVLNLGSKPATDWLFEQYKKSEIKEVVKNSKPGEWNKKSLSFWKKVLS